MLGFTSRFFKKSSDHKALFTIRNSGILDPRWYRSRYRDLSNGQIDPVWHYYHHGASEGRNPGPLFDTNFYLTQVSGVDYIETNPIVHYVTVGAAEKLDPHPLFDTEWYSQQVFQEKFEKSNPILHYLLYGAKHGLSPHPLLDQSHLLDVYPDAKERNFLLLYLEASLDTLERRPHPLFDPQHYLRQLNFAERATSPLVHYLREGWKRGISPSAEFEMEAAILAQRNEGCKRDPLSHYVKHYFNKGRSLAAEQRTSSHNANEPQQAAKSSTPQESLTGTVQLITESGVFDSGWYLRKYPDVARAGADPIEHFLNFGLRELRNPGPHFDAKWYSREHKHLLAPDVSPLEHYLLYGKDQGLPASGSTYERWLQLFNTPSLQDLESIQKDIATANYPTLHVLVSTEGRHDHLAMTLKSLDAQVYDNWKGHLFHTNETSLASVNSRSNKFDIQNKDLKEFLGSLDPSESVVFIRNGVVLEPHTLYLFGHYISRERVKLVYADEDLVDTAGLCREPFFKPDFSPLLAQQIDLLGGCFAAKVSVWKSLPEVERQKSGGMSRAPHLSLKNVIHSPYVLFHDLRTDRRADPIDLDDKVAAAATPGLVSIIIPTRDRVELLEPCIDSILSASARSQQSVEIIIVDNDTTDESTLEYFDIIDGHNHCQVLKSPGRFNYSKLNNEAAAVARGDVLVFVNNDTVVHDVRWLEKLTYFARQQDIGAVGCKLLYPDRTIQHGGVIVGVRGVAAHEGVGLDSDDPALRLDYTREMSAVTGACLAMEKAKFDKIGGFDEAVAVAFNDLMLCLNALKQGWRNIYIRDPLMIHFESKSRGYDDTSEKIRYFQREARYVRDKLGSSFAFDRFYSPNLSLEDMNELAFPPRRSAPWDAPTPARKLNVLFLSCTHELGHGVPVVLKMHAEYLARRGYNVCVGGPEGVRELNYEGCRRVYLEHPEDAAVFAFRERVDCIIAETPPFFSLVRHLGEWPRTIFIDHGEPPPELFPDAAQRQAVLDEKEFCFSMASKVCAISRSIADEGTAADAEVVANGNSHLLVWNYRLAKRRQRVRSNFGWTNKVIVLNVCRFTEAERKYKGLDRYAAIRQDFGFVQSDLAKNVVFVLCGKGREEDVSAMRAQGLEVFSNVTDNEMADFYLAADIYMNLSRWEGYNLGIGQALALGLPVIASDIPPHRDFSVFTSNNTRPCVKHLAGLVEHVTKADFNPKRVPKITAWDASLEVLEKVVVESCSLGVSRGSSIELPLSAAS